MIPRVVDLFSGAGGMALGFQAAGCQIQAAVDVDPVAGETFRRNFALLQEDAPPDVFAGEDHDLGQLELEHVTTEAPDILIGGPPCQGFSQLGRGKLDSLSDEGFVGDPRNQLYRKFLQAAARWRPLAVVMENVRGMLSVAGTNYANRITEELAELGYHTGYALLNAVWYGVPQFRERLFFLGIRADLGCAPLVPPMTHEVMLPEGYRRPFRRVETMLPFTGVFALIEGELPVPTSEHLQPAVTVGVALDDLPHLTDHLTGASLPRGDFRRELSYRTGPPNDYARLMRAWPRFDSPSTLTDHVVRRTPRDYETFRLMKHGDHYPEALAIATQRFEAVMAQLTLEGRAPSRGTKPWLALRSQYVPPYDEREFVQKWGKLFPDQPSWTIPAHLGRDSYSHIHPDSTQARMISVREAARLQSFPDAFQFSGNMGDCFRQIGNAVPPLLAWAIASCLLSVLGKSNTPPPFSQVK